MDSKNQIRSSKTLSLPKLNNTFKNQQQIFQKKPLKQFHKVNWSVAPRCLIQGHQGQPVIYVCVKNQCECITRLVCQKCFYHTHAQHNTNFMAIDQIKACNIQSLRYWPFDTEYKPIFQFIKAHNSYIQNLIQDVKSTFQNLQQNITMTINKVKNIYLQKIQKFYTKQTKKQDYINQLINTVEKSFNFKQIQSCVRQIFNKQIRHDIFVKKMNSIANDTSNKQNLEKINKQFHDLNFDKGKDMTFDKIYFLKRQKIILKSICQLEKSINQEEVVADEAAIGIQTIIVQTVQYLKRSSVGLYPLIYDQKQLQDGTYYNGFSSKGYRALLGLRDYKNGFKYYGQWKNNCRSGWGVYENKQTSYKYAGNWKQDKKNGFGKQITPLYIYQGDFVNDKKQGFGSIRQDGVRIDVTWKNDKKNGKGKRFDQMGQRQSNVKGNMNVVVGQEGQKRDVNFLARMFGNGK